MGRLIVDTTCMPSIIAKWIPHRQQPLTTNNMKSFTKPNSVGSSFFNLELLKTTPNILKGKTLALFLLS
jgi:hypothetical protein